MTQVTPAATGGSTRHQRSKPLIMIPTRVLITGLNTLFTHPLVEKKMHIIIAVCIFCHVSPVSPLLVYDDSISNQDRRWPNHQHPPAKGGASPSRLHGGAAPSRKSS